VWALVGCSLLSGLFTAEVQWFHLDQKFQGTAVLAATAPKPTARYEFKDQDVVQLQVRVQRNF
jgi:hypothetical protein